MNSTSVCPEQYEANARSRRTTHTCDLADPHPDDKHHCPVCGCHWDRPGGLVSVASGYHPESRRG